MKALLRLHEGSVKALIFHGFDKASAEGQRGHDAAVY
jgi:hypothetical protein